jgi:PAS domain S-box-containing protein
MLPFSDEIKSQTSWYRPLRSVLVYAIFGGLWILFSDSLLFSLFSDKALMQEIAMVKGWVFILVTAFLLYFLIIRDLRLIHSAFNKSAESEATFRKLFEGNPLATILVNLEAQTIIEVNDTAQQIYGYSKEELLKQPVALLLAPKTEEEKRKLAKERKISLSQLTGEDTHRKKDGTVFRVELHFHRIVLENTETILLLVKDITEQLRNKELLTQSEARYKQVTHLVSDFIYSCVHTPQNGYSVDWVTEAFHTMTGFTLEELNEHKCWGFVVHPDDKAIFSSMLQEFTLGATNRNEFRIVTKSGEIKWLRNYINYIAEDKVLGIRRVIGAAQDITERKLAAIALRESEEHYRKLFEHSTDAIFVVNKANGKILDANIAAEKLTARSIEELKQLTTFDITVSGAADRLQLMQNRKEFNFGEVEYIRPDGQVRVALLEKIAIDDDTVYSVARDIMELKQTSMALSESCYFLMKSQKVGRMGSYVYQIREHYWSSSEMLDEIFGISASFPKTTAGWLEIIHPDDREAMGKYLSIHVLHEHKPFDTEYRIIRKNDLAVRWVWGLGELEFDETGDAIRMVGTIQDITERKTTEFALLEAKKKAEEMNNLKSSFLANMSHELRTPLNGILGFSELLVDSAIGDDQKLMAQTIHSSGRRLLNTLNLILNLSKIEANKQEINLQPVELNQIINNCIRLYEVYAVNKHITLRYDADVTPLTIVTDPQMLDSVLNNLISNAIKYTDHGSVTVSTRRINGSAVITVQDTGIGIPREQQTIIFEAFRQASEGYGRAFEGTGLGLTITKKYIELLGGSIILESEPDKGTLFTVTFKLTDADAPASADMTEHEAKEYAVSEKLHPVLLVDDDETAFNLAAFMLRDFVDLDYAPSAAEAIEKLKSKRYEAALIDINLKKGISGTQVMKSALAIPEAAGIPLIAFTAYAMEGDKDELLSAGFTHYISKPFSRDEIIQLVRSALGLEEN